MKAVRAHFAHLNIGFVFSDSCYLLAVGDQPLAICVAICYEMPAIMSPRDLLFVVFYPPFSSYSISSVGIIPNQIFGVK